VNSIDTWEVAHIALAVDDLDRWMAIYGKLFPGRWTSVLVLDRPWLAPLTEEGTIQAKCRLAWRNGQSPTLELLEGPEGSPWYVEPGTHRLDHIGYWASDMQGQANLLLQAGYELEYTEPRSIDGKLVGFAYFRHPDGIRVELQASDERAAFEVWKDDGAPLELTWGHHAP